jgi:hypothetical protein
MMIEEYGYIVEEGAPMAEEYRARQFEAEIPDRNTAYWMYRVGRAVNLSIDPANIGDRVLAVLAEYGGSVSR